MRRRRPTGVRGSQGVRRCWRVRGSTDREQAASAQASVDPGKAEEPAAVGCGSEAKFEARALAPDLPWMLKHVAGTCGFMGVPPVQYTKRFSVVELNCTFHDCGSTSYESQAATYARLGLRVVVKVSRHATHARSLDGAEEWWPWLREKYAPFASTGVLVALLWQLPPSFELSEQNLGRLDALGKVLRTPGQPHWAAMRHLLEFRHSSWYGAKPSVAAALRRHSFETACLLLVNDTGWAGDLESGWHDMGADGPPPAFRYLRCFGTAGRSLGKYGEEDLRKIQTWARAARSAAVVFGQGDVPSHATENAGELQELLDGGDLSAETKRWLALAPPPSDAQHVSGTVVAVTRSRERRVVLDVGGRRGYLGSRHSRRRGLELRVGAVLEDLVIEAEAGGALLLSVHTKPRDRAAADGA